MCNYFKTKKISFACCAWTGIAATLLPNGRTVHNLFNLPITIGEKDQRSLATSDSSLYKYLNTIKVLIWDEAPMSTKWALSAADNLLREIKGKKNVPFGGIVTILGGDFR